MNTSNNSTTASFTGAWLTDIDDTLIPSGEKPDDLWIAALADFIRVLKQHNILWAAVSGVAINKMGDRLLFRLPEDVLSNVIYYGGEGSTKNYFDTTTEQWAADVGFQRSFSDAQTLALIGAERFSKALAFSETQEHIEQRITQAQDVLLSINFSKACLIDEMEILLESEGMDKSLAESYYRGGAISWMMLGDKSVKIYKGEKESYVRTLIRDFAHSWLEDNDHLNDLGEEGVNMPYKHATRGIKMVLQGNDKGRAAVDLTKSFHMSAQSILFVGNELFDGGNDNSVRRVDGVHLLSVGEHEDSGVIHGGVQVGANQRWMDYLKNNLEQGFHWNDLLTKIPEQAKKMQLVQAINAEKERKSDLSDLHQQFAPVISSDELADAILQHRAVLENTRHALVSLKNVEYRLLSRLAVLPDYHYDEARKITLELSQEVNQHEDYHAYLIIDKIARLLLSELKSILKQKYVDRQNFSINLIQEHIKNIHCIDDVIPEFNKLFINYLQVDYSLEKEKIRNLVQNWELHIETFVKDWFAFQKNWKNMKKIEHATLLEDQQFMQTNSDIPKDEAYHYFCRLVPRICNFPHLKDLNKPTIVLVAGTSGVGKSTLSQHVSKTLGISTYFSTDVTSRSVMRNAFSYIYGHDARNIFPELFGSSFDEDSMQWFYNQSLLSMIGTTGSIDRLLKENISAVIDGVSLIPGTLEEKYFEIANIVWIVACIKDEKIHYQRMGNRDETGVSRGGAERYKRKMKVIRKNHDRLIEMGDKTDCYIANNDSSLSRTLKRVLQHIEAPFSDRGLPVEDKYRDEVTASLKQKVKDQKLM